MERHIYRTLLIYAVLAVSAFYIYPTIGWMILSDEKREARLEQWAEEDKIEKGFWGDLTGGLKRWAQFDRDQVINLGLDLQGGVHMVLGFDVTPGELNIKFDNPNILVAVETPDGERYSNGGTDGIFPVEVDGRLVSLDGHPVINTEGGTVNLTGDDVTIFTDGSVEVDGENRGQIKLVRFADATALASESDYTMAATAGQRPSAPSTLEPIAGVDVLEREINVQDVIYQRIIMRVNDFEAKEPIIQRLGSNQVQIQLPGEKDPQRAKNLIMKMAVLKFHMVSGQDETQQALLDVDDYFAKKDPNSGFVRLLTGPSAPGYELSAENYNLVRARVEEVHAQGDVLPEGKIFAFSGPPKPGDRRVYTLYLMKEEAEMTGDGLKSAVARPDNANPGRWQILFEFGADGANDFAEVTGNHIGQNMAIVLDGNVVSAPNIISRIFGTGNITGSFSTNEAQDLAISLNSGSMPVPIREDYTGVVGASLGADSVSKGIRSSLIGIAIVMVFMVVYYMIGGVVANLALAFTAMTVLAALAYFNATLTLPGIAGLILTIGMAVDANVLIFERIREELKNGKSLSSAIEGGFAKATITILDANVTTLIAAAVLTQFGTGPVQGFAVTLSIGVCASVFAALIVTRALLEFLSSHKLIENLAMLSIIRGEPKFQFLAKRKIAAAFSLTVIGISLVWFAQRGAANFGVDFTDGTNLMLALESPDTIAVGTVRERLMDAGFDSPTVQEAREQGNTASNRFLVRLGQDSEAAQAELGEDGVPLPIATRVQQALLPLTTNPNASDLDTQVILLKEEFVGPAVGRQLRYDAIAAITYALFFIVAYLWFRFELKFAVGAVVALIHDVVVTVGMFAIFGREITIPVVAALLTIIGYSLNDTIVVFDRIREDTRIYRSKGLPFMEVMDIAINQTLSRTLLTSMTTLFVVVILFFFGGSAINDFAFALMVGVVVGTYSSIFVASPVVLLWDRLLGRPHGPAGVSKTGDKKGPRSRRRKRKVAEAGGAAA